MNNIFTSEEDVYADRMNRYVVSPVMLGCSIECNDVKVLDPILTSSAALKIFRKVFSLFNLSTNLNF